MTYWPVPAVVAGPRGADHMELSAIKPRNAGEEGREMPGRGRENPANCGKRLTHHVNVSHIFPLSV